MTGSELAAASEALAGSPFRLHGRDPATGLDCVGVVLAALSACGNRAPDPHGYGLRNAGVDHWLDLAGKAGLFEAEGETRPGDVLLVRPGPAQQHLLVALANNRFLHAHAGLRRVVVQPGPLPWPILRHWRPNR